MRDAESLAAKLFCFLRRVLLSGQKKFYHQMLSTVYCYSAVILRCVLVFRISLNGHPHRGGRELLLSQAALYECSPFVV